MNNYFPHDSNARNSDKLLPLRMSLGAEGYGIYFMLLERLREEPSYMSVKDYNMLAFDFRVGSDKVKRVVEDFGLFVFTEDGKYFYSEGFRARMEIKNIKSEKARESALKRWCSGGGEDANAMPTQCERNANAMRTHVKTDAIKEKESKVNNNTPYNPPEGEMPTGKKDESEESEKPTISSTDTTGCAGNTPPSSAAPPSKGERRAKKFVPPTIEEVATYCAERKNSVSPAKFINYYTSNGWRVGKNPMKDWRAAVRTWENNDYDNEKRPNTTDKQNAFRGAATNEVRYGSTTSAKQALLDEITRADREKLAGDTSRAISLRGEFDDGSFGPEVDVDSQNKKSVGTF